jgi:hypothetical protein
MSPVLRRALAILTGSLLLVFLSPSVAFACGGVSYEGGGGETSDCGEAASLTGAVLVGAAAATAALALALASFLRGKVSEAEFTSILAAISTSVGAKPTATRGRADPDAGVPSRYQEVRYGSTTESRLVQAARLQHVNKRNVYGAVTWKDGAGNRYESIQRSDRAGHAEQYVLDDMRQQVAARQGKRPEEVDLTQMTDVTMFIEFSPCDTPPRWCQQELADNLPQAEVSYSWPWSPRDARAQSRVEFATAVETLFQRGSVGEI